MPDFNKTELTQNITRKTALWLEERGFKPVETEVYVAERWVADLAGVICPTQSELVDLKLLRRSPRCDYYNVDEETKRIQRERYEIWHAEREAALHLMTVTVEVKTSVGDYRGDPKWTREWPTDLCYVAMPEGMIPKEEWPQDWGVILFSRGDDPTVRKVHPPKPRSTEIRQQRDIILAVAMRRDNVTRHARLRELQKEIRIREGERTSVTRIGDAVRFVCAVAKGTPIDEAANWHGIKRHSQQLPGYIMRELGALVPNPPVSDSLSSSPEASSTISDVSASSVRFG